MRQSDFYLKLSAIFSVVNRFKIRSEFLFIYLNRILKFEYNEFFRRKFFNYCVLEKKQKDERN